MMLKSGMLSEFGFCDTAHPIREIPSVKSFNPFNPGSDNVTPVSKRDLYFPGYAGSERAHSRPARMLLSEDKSIQGSP